MQNKQNDFKVKISKDVTSKKLVDLQKDKYTISWNLDKVNKSEAVIANIEENKIKDEIEKSVDDKINKDKELSSKSITDKEEAKNILTENEKTKTLEKVNSNVNFMNVFENTDLQYILKGSQVKENLILNKKSDNISYSFNINVKNLNAALKEYKSIIFYDSKDKTKEVFKIESPIMYDKVGTVSDNVKISLNQTKDGYVLVITPDKEWINSSDRVYPVTIDPSMETSLDVNSIHDTFVASNDTDNKWVNQFVRVGKTPIVGTTRTYIKFDLPKLSTGDMITNAQLNLQFCASASSVSGNQINAHKVTGNLDTYSVAWSNQPSYDPNVEALSVINSNVDQWVSWDITSIAKQWFTNSNNNGLMLEGDSGTGHSAFWASDIDNSYAGARPQVSFEFINNNGLEDYWTYHSQSVGRAGTSYINDYNGNMVVIHNDIEMSGNRMPIAISHVYNSNDRNNQPNQYGFGWRLNINQKIGWKAINGIGYYIYIDEDGTCHYFEDKPGTEMNDELNLGLKLKQETDKSYTITDKKSNKLSFNAGTCDLKEIKDANGNTMTFSYGTASSGNSVRILTKVTDGSGRYVDLTYDPVGGLATIKDMAGRITNYSYDAGGRLISIKYPDDKISTYNYDGNNNLTSVINYDGYKMAYQYYGMAPYRIKDILESNTDGTLGGQLGVFYGNNSTIFTDVKGRKNVYQFNNIGKTLGIKDSDGNAKYYQYGDATNATKLTLESKLQKTVVNLLGNHNVETNDLWLGDADGGSGISKFSTTASYLGKQSLEITKSDKVSRQYMNQWVGLEKGKTYTFSAYVKTSNVSNTNGKGATMTVYYKDKLGAFQPAESKSISGTNDWQRQEVTFTIPIDAYDEVIVARVSLLQETGTVYYDNLQLEEGKISNRYNLIDNGDITGTSGAPSKWNPSGTSGSDGTVTIKDYDHPTGLNNSVYQVSGVYGVEKRLGQSVNVSGKKGDVYSLGGWAKGYSVPSGTFQMQAAFITSSGAQWATFDFNKDSNDWQYVSGECIAKSDYSRIDIYYLFKDNANTAYFDGVQLYKEEFGESYQYDSKGNIVTTANLAQQNSRFLYTVSNDLVQSVDPKGGEFNYEYDSKHKLTRANSATGVGYSFDYDSYGNPISARVGDGTNYIQTKAEYSTSGNYVKSLTDSLGNAVNYSYNETKGLLDTVKDAKGNTTTNTYNPKNDNLEKTSKPVDNQIIANSYTYENDKIDTITHYGASYKFGYDSIGNTTKVNVGNQNLITNTYEPRTSALLKSTYGNGQSVSTGYDKLDRVTSKVVDGDSTVGVTYDAQVQDIGWQPWVSNNDLAGTTGKNLKMEALKIKLTTPISGMKIKYQAHVEDVGWQDWVYDGNLAGTTGLNRRIEAIKIQLEGAPAGYVVRYQVHVENLGWMDPVENGEMTGTTGENRRIEAIKIYIEKARYIYDYDAAGNLAYQGDFINNVTNRYVYDTSNRLSKVSDSNGNELGYKYDLNNNISSVTDKVNNINHTTSYVYDKDNRLKSTTYGSSVYENNYDNLGRIETSAIKTGTAQYNIGYGYFPGISTSNTGVTYSANVQSKGWQTEVTNGSTAGTTGQGVQMEALKIQLTTPLTKMKIKYQAHVQDVGWQDWVYDGNMTGTTGQNRQMEAVRIQLEGAPEGYHISYQVHVKYIGWMEPVQDGNIAGTVGQGLRVEAIRIFLVKPGSDSKSSNKIGTLDNNGKKVNYTYDANGNIETITENGSIIKYTYNELNELKREDNQVLNKTMVYNYDAGGNITNKLQYPYKPATLTEELGTAANPISYVYGDANWKDKLTIYNGKEITYSPAGKDIGNPLTYDGYTYEWESGRQLKGIKGNGKTIDYKYTDSGIRTQKIVNGVTTNYHLEGDKVTYESNGTDNVYYTYDSVGNIVSMNLNGVEYYYIKNATNDIIGLFDKAGTQVVSYTYDTWGKLISTTGSLASTVGVKNPYRYKGYRYDTETGLYYLQSRYYNAEWGRFINADGIVGTPGDLLSCNMFAYCKNNPINLMDIDGRNPFAAILAWGAEAIVAALVTTVEIVAAPLLVITAIGVVGYLAYDYFSSDASSDSDGGGKISNPGDETVSQPEPTNNGKSKNKLKPDPNAEGDHTTFKRDPNTGKITNYETWRPNPQRPKTGFDSVKRYDGIGRPHINPITKEKLMPHVHDKTVPGGVRSPISWEIPLG